MTAPSIHDLLGFAMKVFRKIGLLTVFLTILLTILLSGTLRTVAAMPNLDDDSHPNRVKVEECIADVKQVTEWDANATQKAALNVCQARQSHAKEKARFVAALGKLSAQYKDYTNHGFSQHLPTATNDAWAIVKNCIDFQQGFRSPHNVAVLIVPEDIRKSCYTLGSGLVESQLFTGK